MKKIGVVIAIISILLAMTMMSVHADESGNVIGLNNDNEIFDEVVCMKDGEPYLPLRLVFPNLNDTDNKVGMSTKWEDAYSCVHLIHGATNGEGYIKMDDGTTLTPFVGTRRCVDIFWEGDIESGVKATLSVMDYTYDESGNMIIDEDSYTEEEKLDNLIYLKKANGGERIFVSIDDINKLADLLGLNSEYSVKVYK